MEGVIEHAEDIKGKVGENLRDSLQQLPLSYQLATIVCDVKLEQGPGDLKLAAADEAKLKQIYSELELKTWLAELGGDSSKILQQVLHQHQLRKTLKPDTTRCWMKKASSNG